MSRESFSYVLSFDRIHVDGMTRCQSKPSANSLILFVVLIVIQREGRGAKDQVVVGPTKANSTKIPSGIKVKPGTKK